MQNMVRNWVHAHRGEKLLRCVWSLICVSIVGAYSPFIFYQR